ncbi:class I SAM-dependent methyltransferase [Falsiroseomonas oryzae]|uniref:class I SAM-dependent methyltransferase n=1 Tax=Falsiroseomonas oryzae TaxID=2766473 RepID=UPI0022EA694A|nr:class I SAM-dependent methyltransferase [Roseomonas sp. MO-31]
MTSAAAGLGLDALGRLHGTDKASHGHGYLEIYEPFFRPLRDAPIRLLEIGVDKGNSLRLWKAYFPLATVIGADIVPEKAALAEDRIAIEIVDQSQPAQLEALARRHGPFDIVVEDGSHIWGHQIVSLQALLPFVRPGGLYVVEDLHTNFGSLAPRFRRGAPFSCVEYLQRLAALCVAGQREPAEEPDAFLRAQAGQVESVLFAKHCAIIRRAVPLDLRASLPILPAAPPGFEMLVSIGGVGDVRSATGSAGFPERGAIKGFRLIPAPTAPDVAGLLARVRDADGGWSAWQPARAFAGGRRHAGDLTGFALRAAEGTAPPLRLVGRFRGVAEPVVVPIGADCVAPHGLAPLEAMQILRGEPPAA